MKLATRSFRNYLAGMGSTLSLAPAEEEISISSDTLLSAWWMARGDETITVRIAVPSSFQVGEMAIAINMRSNYFAPADEDSIRWDWDAVRLHLISAVEAQSPHITIESIRVEEPQT